MASRTSVRPWMMMCVCVCKHVNLHHYCSRSHGLSHQCPSLDGVFVCVCVCVCVCVVSVCVCVCVCVW